MTNSKKKVLVVDDELEIVDFLERFLKRFNITVLRALNGDAAIQEYENNQPDWIFLDIMMPNKDGITVLKEIKKINPQAQVIMITGKEDKAIHDRAKKAGAVDYITKPLDLGELSNKIKEYILT